MLLVSINGLMQVPGIDYTSCNNAVSFSTPPPMGSSIDIRNHFGTLARIHGDGSTYLFQFSDYLDRDTLTVFDDAIKLKDNPAVADALERLRVVVELVKEHDPIRKR